MLRIRFDFPTGRYHATPWGAHVNEGRTEWPPSPWRFLRALVAVGYSRLGWTDVPPAARELLLALASVTPTYYLPPANAAHTRHYMPLYNGDPTKVFDTFVYVGTDPLVIAYDVALSPSSLALLDELLAALPYLGRAESAVVARRIDELPSCLHECDASDVCPSPGLDRVPLLAPELPDRYDPWRAAAVESESAALLADAVAKAVEKGTKPPKAISKKDAERLDGMFPPDIVEALQVSTRDLQALGWSQPPGSRWLSYWRPANALSAPAAQRSERGLDRDPTTALLALTSDTVRGGLLPPLTDAVRRMETLHQAFAYKLGALGKTSPALTGKDGGIVLRGHKHATLIPLALGRRGDRIDHVLVHAPMGLDRVARRVLEEVTATYAKNLPRIFVTLVGFGDATDFAKLVPNTRKATTWVSSTPFVPPRHPKTKGKDTVEAQALAELDRWGGGAKVEIVDGMRARFRHFRRERSDQTKRPPVSWGLGVRLTFDEPVQGPISIGYGSHFGLGTFVPEG